MIHLIHPEVHLIDSGRPLREPAAISPMMSVTA
jgi:hypothetical protein